VSDIYVSGVRHTPGVVYNPDTGRVNICITTDDSSDMEMLATGRALPLRDYLGLCASLVRCLGKTDSNLVQIRSGVLASLDDSHFPEELLALPFLKETAAEAKVRRRNMTLLKIRQLESEIVARRVAAHNEIAALEAKLIKLKEKGESV